MFLQYKCIDPFSANNLLFALGGQKGGKSFSNDVWQSKDFGIENTHAMPVNEMIGNLYAYENQTREIGMMLTCDLEQGDPASFSVMTDK